MLSQIWVCRVNSFKCLFVVLLVVCCVCVCGKIDVFLFPSSFNDLFCDPIIEVYQKYISVCIHPPFILVIYLIYNHIRLSYGMLTVCSINEYGMFFFNGTSEINHMKNFNIPFVEVFYFCFLTKKTKNPDPFLFMVGLNGWQLLWFLLL